MKTLDRESLARMLNEYETFVCTEFDRKAKRPIQKYAEFDPVQPWAKQYYDAADHLLEWMEKQ